MRKLLGTLLLVTALLAGYKLGPGALRALPFSSEKFGPPRGVTLGGPDRIFVQTAPETLLKIPSGPMYVPPMGVHIVKNGRIVGRDGEVITGEDKILLGTTLNTDAQLRSPKQIKGHHLLKRFKLPQLRKVPGRVAVVASGSSSCYAHWMADALPKLKILQDSKIPYDKLYIPSPKMPFHAASLKRMKIPEEKVIFADKKTHIQADEVLAVTLPTSGSKIPKWVADFLADSFTPSSQINCPDKIFISREKSRRRRIDDEEKIWDLLKAQGFTKVYSEEKTLEEQAALFAGAKIIVAQHGAGLVNLAFCKKGTQIVELFPPSCAPRCFEDLAATLDLPYRGIFCLKEGKGGNYLTNNLDDLENHIAGVEVP